MRSHISFYLNDTMLNLDGFAAETTVLDYLRLTQRLMGTKEGCAEGDCGACTVLVGRLSNGLLQIESVNACIRLLATLDGCFVLTVEHLSNSANLHPVQQAMVAYHGSQCGFCTPGFVMSLYALWLETDTPTRAQVTSALQGNLCRCTGYAPIIRAAQNINTYGARAQDAVHQARGDITQKLALLALHDSVKLRHPTGDFYIPHTPEQLTTLLASLDKPTLLAGSTDVGLWVTKFMKKITPVVYLGNIPALQTIRVSPTHLHLGATVTYTQASNAFYAHIPQLAQLLQRIGGAQVRNMGTIGGNIANGSPIGDMPPALIALGTTITLRSAQGTRELPLEDYFIAYGKQDRAPDEFLETISIPLPLPDAYFAVYKISKRREEDITTLLGAFYLEEIGGVVEQARVCFGGMAAIPKRAAQFEAAIIGEIFKRETFETAIPLLAQDYIPLSDWRGSSGYRTQVAQNLALRFVIESTEDTNIQVSDFTLLGSDFVGGEL